jgi:predicted nucleic-acid-binding Zn-ribbon protein
MKQSNVCPKCSSREIIRIPGQAGAYGSGNNIPMGTFIFSSIKVTRYLCGHCGYSEEWIDNPDDLKKIKNKFGKNSG